MARIIKNVMTPKQSRFVAEYLIDLNATQAAIRAGYSAKTANEQAARLLAHVSIASAIREAQEKRAERTEITVDRVLLEYARIAFYDPSRVLRVDDRGNPVIDFSNATEDDWRVLAEIGNETTETLLGEDAGVRRVTRAKVKQHCKLRALEMIAKHLGMLTERMDVTSGGKSLTQSERITEVVALLDAARARASQ